MNKLRELRRRSGLTQIELAEELNISQSALSTYETGRINIDNETLVKLARYFGVSIDELLGIEPDAVDMGEISDVEYALAGEIRGLSDAEKQDVLDYIRFKRSQRSQKTSK